MKPEIVCGLADTNEAFTEGRQLIQEYLHSLPIDLSFQQVDQELANLRQQYSTTSGGLLLVYGDGAATGCAGVRALDATTAELKRMYVQPIFRGLPSSSRSCSRTAAGSAKATGASSSP